MNEDKYEALRAKAEVLIEALPYIQRFNRRIIVVKYGGSAMLDEELKQRVIQDVTLLKLVGFKPIIVHGGGKEISKWVSKAGMEPKFIDGLRVTDAETMEIAEMVLNKVNKNLVRMVEELGVRAIGVSGKDGGLLRVDKKLSMTGHAYPDAASDRGHRAVHPEEVLSVHLQSHGQSQYAVAGRRLKNPAYGFHIRPD